MRALTLVFALFFLSLLSAPKFAKAEPDPSLASSENTERYGEFYLDYSAIAGQQNFAQITKALRHQIDIVEGVGLSPRILKFFRTVPIVVDEAACLDFDMQEGQKAPVLAAACFSRAPLEHLRDKPRDGTILDNKTGEWANRDPVVLAEDTHLGVIMARPRPLASDRPVLLHEMLHAYHAHVMPRGVKNPSILFFYSNAQSKKLYPDDAYLMTNDKEFFAVISERVSLRKRRRFQTIRH